MDLKEFISSSLTQIVEGICDTQAKSAESGAWISPVGSGMPHREGARQINSGDGYQYLDEVKFDVAVSVSDGKKGGAEAGLKILSMSLKGGGAVDTRHSAVSRIQFSVPVVWPGSTNKEREQQIADKKAQVTEKINSMARQRG